MNIPYECLIRVLEHNLYSCIIYTIGIYCDNMKYAFTSLVEINDDLLVSFRFVVIQAAGAVHHLVYQK